MKKNNKKQNNKKNKKTKGNGLPLGPPTINMQPVFTRKMQYQVTTANCLNQVVTVTQLAQLSVGFMALTATTSAFFTNQYRIRKISLWSPCPAIGSLTMVSLKWADTVITSGLAQASHQSGDSSMEPDRPAKCFIKPGRGTIFDWYQVISSTNNCFVITCPIGSVIQIEVSFYLDNSGTVTAGPTIAAAAAGVIYNKSVTLSGGAVVVPHTSINTI